MRVFLYLVITILLSLPAPPTVRAEPDSVEATDATREASQRFRRGVTLFREGAFRAALIEFQRAYELRPHFALLSNIGQTHLELGDYLAASNALRRYLDVGGTDVPPERREKVEKQLAGLQERIAVLTISVNLQGAEIFVDEEPVGKSPLAEGLAVNVGRHVVRVRSSAGQEDSKVLDVAGGDVRELNFKLEQSAEEAAVAASPAPDTGPAAAGAPVASLEPVEKESRRPLYRKIAFWSLIGTGALAAGTVVAIVLQKRQMDAYEKDLDTTDVDPNLVAVHQANAWRTAVAVDVLAGLTLAAAGTGVTFWLLGRGSKHDERSGVRLGISGSQLLLKGRF